MRHRLLCRDSLRGIVANHLLNQINAGCTLAFQYFLEGFTPAKSVSHLDWSFLLRWYVLRKFRDNRPHGSCTGKMSEMSLPLRASGFSNACNNLNRMRMIRTLDLGNKQRMVLSNSYPVHHVIYISSWEESSHSQHLNDHTTNRPDINGISIVSIS